MLMCAALRIELSLTRGLIKTKLLNHVVVTFSTCTIKHIYIFLLFANSPALVAGLA